MNFNEMIKFQLLSQMGSHNNQNNLNILMMFYQFFMVILMSIMDDLGKSVPKFFNEIKEKISNKFSDKVKEKINNEIIKPKNLSETSISLNTRHFVNTVTMTRIFQKENNSSSSTTTYDNTSSEESNRIVDSVLSYISKLDNIPTLSLINKGNFMIVFKDKSIQMTKDIYVKIDNITFTTTGDLSSIKLSLLSNNISSAEITKYVMNLYNNYLQEIKNSLGNNIYFFDQKSLEGSPPPLPNTLDSASIENHKMMLIKTAPKQLSFTMTPFYSNKKFSNIFGNDIRLIEHRVIFFLENRQWYDDKGIPYQLGLLLSGLAGSGKSSCVKAIANLTKRHIINVNFGNIKTATQLKNLFYSEKINVYDSSFSNQQSYFIPVDQRLYVLEEIDAIGDIVKQRTMESENEKVLNDQLTLGEILTVLDGTMEIPGRIIIITTNHPEMLDKALIRPGRIDVHVKFGYADCNLIKEMYEAYLDTKIPEEEINNLPDKLLSPAEISQVLFRHFNSNHSYKEIIEDLNNTAKQLGRITEESSCKKTNTGCKETNDNDDCKETNNNEINENVIFPKLENGKFTQKQLNLLKRIYDLGPIEQQAIKILQRNNITYNDNIPDNIFQEISNCISSYKVTDNQEDIIFGGVYDVAENNEKKNTEMQNISNLQIVKDHNIDYQKTDKSLRNDYMKQFTEGNNKKFIIENDNIPYTSYNNNEYDNFSDINLIQPT